MTSVAKPSIVQLTKALAVAGAFVAYGCGTGNSPASGLEQFVLQGEAQGTTYTIKYLAMDSVPHAVVTEVLRAVDDEMNAWRPDSWISKVNAMPADTVVLLDLHGVWRDVWSQSQRIHDLSGGAFDVTVAPWMRLWGFRSEHADVVTQQQVDSVRLFAGMDRRAVEVAYGDSIPFMLVKHDERAQLDFNAIAQGYTVDLMLEALMKRGVRHAMVELGGEVRCLGQNATGLPWRIAVDRPQEEGRTLQAILAIENQAVCTSGNYRKVRVVNGQKVSHTIDPRTGYPVTHGLLSATILAPTAAEADAYATACMVMGPDSAKAWLGQLGPDVEALFIVDGAGESFEFWASPTLQPRLEWLED